MGMIARVLPLLIAAAALTCPAQAAPAVPLETPNFDGARSRPEGDFVTAGASGDRRTADQIARDEQVKADARRAGLKATTPGPDTEIVPPEPAEWSKSEHILSGVKGAMIGLLIGSLWGLTGLGIGVLVGGLIGYGISRITA